MGIHLSLSPYCPGRRQYPTYFIHSFKNALPTSPNPTTQLYFERYFSHSVIFGSANLSYALIGKGFFSQSRNFNFFYSSYLPNPDSPAAPLPLILATHPTVSNRSISLPASQGDLQVWDTQNAFIPKYHSSIVIQLQDPTWNIIQIQYPFLLQSLRGLKLMISYWWRLLVHFPVAQTRNNHTKSVSLQHCLAY